VGGSLKLALEIKSGHDDVIRGLGQLTAALAHGYNSAALVVSLRHAKKLNLTAFSGHNIVVLSPYGVGESSGIVKVNVAPWF